MARPLVLTVEHASARVPAGLWLGLPPAVVASHVGWDPGALPLGRALAAELGAALFAGQVSRLVVDLNRRAGHPEVVPRRAFGVAVPGNLGLSEAQRQARLARWHAPFRGAVARAVAQAVAGGGCLHLSLHSFDPSLSADRAGLEVGVLFDPARAAEAAWCGALLDRLAAAGLSARANAPYAGTAEGHTTALREAHARGYLGVEIELAQGLAADRVERLRAALAGAARGA